MGNEVTFPAARLRRVGASEAEITAAHAAFTNLSSEERHDTIDALAALSDPELAEEITLGRDGYPDTLLGVPHGAGETPQAPDTAPSGAQAGAAPSPGLTGGTIPDVLARVAGDKGLALDALREEQAGRNRSTLVRELRAILRG